MKKRLKIIVIISIIISIIILIINLKRKNIPEEEKEQILYIEKDVIEVDKKIPIYNSVSDIVQKYIEDLSINNVLDYYNILSKDYINQNQLTEENIKEQLKLPFEVQNFEIQMVKEKIIKFDAFSKYFIKVNLIGDNQEQDLNLIINVDFINSAYSIEPVTEIEDIIKEYKEMKEEDIEYTTITKNSYNEFCLDD